MSVGNSLGYQGFPLPVGTVLPFAGAPALLPGGQLPYGWLPCDGSSYNIADYPDLYRIIGTTYGAGGFLGYVRQEGNSLYIVEMNGTLVAGDGPNPTGGIVITTNTPGNIVLPDMLLTYGSPPVNHQVLSGTGTIFTVNGATTSSSVAIPATTASPAPPTGVLVVGMVLNLGGGYQPVTVTGFVGGVAQVTPAQTMTGQDFELASAVGFKTPNINTGLLAIAGGAVPSPTPIAPSLVVNANFTLTPANVPYTHAHIVSSSFTAALTQDATNASEYSKGTLTSAGAVNAFTNDGIGVSTFSVAVTGDPTFQYNGTDAPVSLPVTFTGFQIADIEIGYIIKAQY